MARNPCLLGLLLSCICVLQAQAASWGASVTVTNGLMRHLTKIALQKLENDIRQITIPEYNTQVGGGTLNLRKSAIDEIKMPKLSISFESPAGIIVRTKEGHLSASTWFSYKSRWFGSAEGDLEVSASGFNAEVAFKATANEFGNIVLSSTGPCDVSISDLSITSQGKGVLMKLEKLLNGAVETVARKQLASFICGTVDSTFSQFSNLSHTLLVPIETPLAVDLTLTANPFIGQGYLQTTVLAKVFSPYKPASKKPPLPMDLPPLPQKMFQALLSDYTIDTLLRTLTQNFEGEGFLLESTESNPISFLKTTCPGIPPLCIGRLLRSAGKRFPNSTVTVLAKPFGYPHCTISPTGVNVAGGLQFQFTATTPQNQKFSSTLALAFAINVGRVLMKNGQVKIRDVTIEQLNGRVLASDNAGLISEKDIARLEDILKPVLKFYAEDFLLETKIDPVKGFPVQLKNAELQLRDGALMFESDFDLSALLTDETLRLLPAQFYEKKA